MGLVAGVADASTCMDVVVAEIFRTMMRCACVPCEMADAWEEAIRARVFFVDSEAYECDVRLGTADADALVVLLTGRADSTVRGDVAGELCNMIAGGWMKLFGPGGGKVELRPPVMEMMEPEEVKVTETYLVFAGYSFDGGTFLLRLRGLGTLQVS